MRLFTVVTIEPLPKAIRSTGGLPGPNWCTWCCYCGAPIVVSLRTNEVTLAIMCAPCAKDD